MWSDKMQRCLTKPHQENVIVNGFGDTNDGRWTRQGKYEKTTKKKKCMLYDRTQRCLTEPYQEYVIVDGFGDAND